MLCLDISTKRSQPSSTLNPFYNFRSRKQKWKPEHVQSRGRNQLMVFERDSVYSGRQSCLVSSSCYSDCELKAERANNNASLDKGSMYY